MTAVRWCHGAAVVVLLLLSVDVAAGRNQPTVLSTTTATKRRFQRDTVPHKSSLSSDDASPLTRIQSIPRGGFSVPVPAVINNPTNVASFLSAMDLLGTAVFAFSTAVGGGTLRDCFLGTGTVFWLKNPIYLQISLVTAWLTLLFWPKLEQNLGITGSELPVCIADAIGLAAFAVVGAQKAAGLGLPTLAWVVCGLLSACFGGVVRDVVCREKSRIMYPQRTLYGVPPMMGAVMYALLSVKTSMETHLIVCLSFATTLLL
eukprot:CAMPEP_0168850642 /NCGR_PEP_ID=MMETSP0727-20121128/11989_1 /TAXON_ID=265536 /ORGANISM="Amphiprora sp., Strain CCMP467" /LENGTH=259 /DNA_ID=CAMNT_0008904585 /DNA_START=50 /DNA_END=826 /DNA_ORIENTATION=+